MTSRYMREPHREQYVLRGKFTESTVAVTSDRASISPPWALAISRVIYSPSLRLSPGFAL